MSKMVRRVVSIALAFAVAISLGGFSGTAAKAQGQAGTSSPGVWQSSINIQNTSTTAATVSIDFYDANGTRVTTYNPTGPIAANGSLSIFVPSQVAGLAAGQFSAVVNSDQPVKATVNTASTNSTAAPWTAMGYEGMGDTETGPSLYFPGLYKGYYNFNSEMVIQNADSAAATLTATFFNPAGTRIAGPIALGTLAPNASKTFTTQGLTQLPSGNQTGKFGAVITSSESRKLVGVANIWRTSPTNGSASYNGFTGGSSVLYAPALYNNYYGFASALTLQAIGGAASGTITYSNGRQTPFNLAAGAAQEFYQPANANLPSGNSAGVFSAKVTATTGKVVGLVSLSVPSGARGDFASYNVPGTPAAQVGIVNVMSNYFGYFSAVTVQNTGSTPTNITIRFANGKTDTALNVPANGTKNFVYVGNNAVFGTTSTSTSAVVSSSNGNPLVAVVQHNTAAGVTGNNAAKLPSDFLIAQTGSAR